MFVTKNQIRMHDIDMVGILYFPRQFRIVHEALEDFLDSEGYRFDKIFNEENFLFVIVHCESSYLAPLKLADKLEVQVSIEHIGTTSFTIYYTIFRDDGLKVGTAKTVHVCIDSQTRKKIPIPEPLMGILVKHQNTV